MSDSCSCGAALCGLPPMGQGFTNIGHEQFSLRQSLYCNVGKPCVYGSTARAGIFKCVGQLLQPESTLVCCLVVSLAEMYRRSSHCKF